MTCKEATYKFRKITLLIESTNKHC